MDVSLANNMDQTRKGLGARGIEREGWEASQGGGHILVV